MAINMTCTIWPMYVTTHKLRASVFICLNFHWRPHFENSHMTNLLNDWQERELLLLLYSV